MAAVSDDYSDEYDEYYDDEEGVSGLTILGFGVLIILAFSLSVVFAYRSGVASEQSRQQDVPLVTADAGPVKTEREIEVPSSTRPEVDQRLSGNDAPAEVVVDAGSTQDPLAGFEQTTSASEQASRSDATPADPDPVTRSAPSTEMANAAPSTGPRIDQSTPAQSPAQSSTQAETQPQAQPSSSQSAVPQRSVPTQSAPTRPDPAATTAGAAAATSGTHLVQVGAFGSEAEARGYFDRLSERFPALVGAKQPDIQRADLGSRGVFYRLRIGPFASSSAANSHCSQLKAGGQDCLTRAVD